MPLVSVLMSNYKTPVSYLKKSIESILNQSTTDLEFVIVNDGSKDNSRQVIYEYAQIDSRIVVVENEQNIGLPRSLNKGIEYCNGEYIARMDTDDICYPDRLEKQVAYMDASYPARGRMFFVKMRIISLKRGLLKCVVRTSIEFA